jgi:hypothetical protein
MEDQSGVAATMDKAANRDVKHWAR